ncbi:MAG: LmbU family transcriptional regulator [Pseudonocardiaceae bacterium]
MLDFRLDQRVHVQQNGLSLAEGLSFDSWRELGHKVTHVVSCSAWWLGDWVIYGERAYGDRYKQVLADTSLRSQTLRNYAWVAKKFPMSRRRDNVSFAHHAEVAALPEDQQDMWLERAEGSKLSVSQLRQRVHAEQLGNRRASDGDQPLHVRVLKIDVPAERHDRWKSAAKRNNCSVTDWIIAALDRVASEA